MCSITFTLLSEGSSDRALIPILRWLLGQHLPGVALNADWADLRRLPIPPRPLKERIKHALELYPCDVLFVHRDADRSSIKARAGEIAAAVNKLRSQTRGVLPACIPVIPVRTTEAWLLLEEQAIREAASNPRGRSSLSMPKLHELEHLADPKAELDELLRTASELSGRRLKDFNLNWARQRIPEYIKDFGKLRKLSAFNRLEADVRAWCVQTSRPGGGERGA